MHYLVPPNFPGSDPLRPKNGHRQVERKKPTIQFSSNFPLLKKRFEKRVKKGKKKWNGEEKSLWGTSHSFHRWNLWWRGKSCAYLSNAPDVRNFSVINQYWPLSIIDIVANINCETRQCSAGSWRKLQEITRDNENVEQQELVYVKILKGCFLPSRYDLLGFFNKCIYVAEF